MTALRGEADENSEDSLGELAAAYAGVERWEEAERILQRVIAARERRRGADSPDTIASRDALASLLLAQSRLAEAQPIPRRDPRFPGAV
jgi:hypothetical protein